MRLATRLETRLETLAEVTNHLEICGHLMIE